MRFSLFIIFCLAFLFSCVRKQSVEINSDTHQQLNELYQTFHAAYDSVDVELVSNLYTEDAHYLVPNPKQAVFEGRPSIRKSFAGFMNWAKENNRDIEINFRIIERRITDSLAYDVGYYRTRTKPDSVATFPEGGGVGKFVTILGRQTDGTWKFLLDGYSQAPHEAFLQADSTGFNPVTE